MPATAVRMRWLGCDVRDSAFAEPVREKNLWEIRKWKLCSSGRSHPCRNIWNELKRFLRWWIPGISQEFGAQYLSVLQMSKYFVSSLSFVQSLHFGTCLLQHTLATVVWCNGVIWRVAFASKVESCIHHSSFPQVFHLQGKPFKTPPVRGRPRSRKRHGSEPQNRRSGRHGLLWSRRKTRKKEVFSNPKCFVWCFKSCTWQGPFLLLNPGRLDDTDNT